MVDSTTKNNAVNGKFFKNITIVLFSNIVSLVSGILIGFIIPKIMGLTEYGYYKTFTLYSSYIGLLHFGFVDGIYLKFAGKSYEELNKPSFRFYSRFLFLMEAIISLAVVAASSFFIGSSHFLIVLFLGLNILATNVVTYYEFIGQITMQFKKTTLRNIIRCSLNIVSVVGLYLLYRFNQNVIYNYVYAIVTVSINYLLAIWYVFSYRDITFGASSSFDDEKDNLVFFFKVGIPLLLSNIVAQLIFVVDQQFVNLAFSVDEYSLYAFAYNMISLITTLTSAISIVLYPTLKAINEESITRNYSKLNSYFLMIVAFCLVIYYPLILVVNRFLPQYIGSLQTFLIIVPGVMISSSISVIKYNCYKTFNKVNNYFIKSIFVLALAIIADLVVYYLFKDTKAISIVSIIVLLIWYILVELFFVRNYQAKWVKNFLFVILVLGGFYGLSFVPNAFLGLGFYLLFYFALIICLYFREIKDIIMKLKERKRAKEAVNK